MANKWFADAALQLESFYVRHIDQIGRVSAIGGIWGTRVEDLKSPMGVAGRVLRTIPEVVGLARSFTQEPNTVYALAILHQELPHVFLGEGKPMEGKLVNSSEINLDTEHITGLLKGVASVLNLKLEEVPLFHNSKGEPDILAFKAHLGDGVVIGTLLRKDGSTLFCPLYSTHDADTTRKQFLKLWEKRNIVGLDIRPEAEEAASDFSSCAITPLGEDDTLVVGNEFANDYLQIAKRIQRFERAGYRRNLMLLGPPGCGKTSIARQIAREIGRFIINVDSEFLSSKTLISMLTCFFPEVILICDDFDRYHGNTQNLLASLERTGVSLIVTCNTIYGFDRATVRVGRIDEIIEVPKPDAAMRMRLFEHFNQLASSAPLPTPEQFEKIIKHTDGFTPAEMREVVKCWEVLGYEDSQLEILRLKKQAKLAEALWFKVDWAQTPEAIDSDSFQGKTQGTGKKHAHEACEEDSGDW